MTAMATVRSSAPWCGEDYSANSAHHRAADELFLSQHRPSERDTIVDLGCGSGEFTATLAGLAPQGRVIGIDSDETMLAAAARLPARPNLSFVHGEATSVNRIVSAGTADTVVSRAMLHWLPAERHPGLFAAIFDVLRPGGTLHLEAPAPGNVDLVIELLNELAARYSIPWESPFPDPVRTMELLEVTGFDITDESVGTRVTRRRFDRTQVAGMFRTQAVLMLTRQVDPGLALRITRDGLSELDRLRRHDGSFDQTFVRLEILVRRPLEA